MQTYPTYVHLFAHRHHARSSARPATLLCSFHFSDLRLLGRGLNSDDLVQRVPHFALDQTGHRMSGAFEAVTKAGVHVLKSA